MATTIRLAIVGFGNLGRACAAAAAESPAVRIVGVVRRPGATTAQPPDFPRLAVADHLRDLEAPHGVLLCVPPAAATEAAREILQLGFALVECAILEGRRLQAHHEAIGVAARNHRVAAIVGAGWDPGMLPLLQRSFEVLVPRGRTIAAARPATSLHHTEAARNVAGIVDALATEYRDAQGRTRRHVYAQLAPGADPDGVRAALAADPLYAGEETLLFPVPDIAALAGEAQGIVLERRGTARSGAHHNILLEARFSVPAFAARVMLDAALRLPRLAPGAHRYWLDGGQPGAPAIR